MSVPPRDPPPSLGGTSLMQRPCYITSSTEETARVVRENLDRSPMYAGRIGGTGCNLSP